jgi:hypothetical protein
MDVPILGEPTMTIDPSQADLGDPVFVDSFEGFGGPAVIVDRRDCPTSHFKVAMDDGSQRPFWAHDFELRFQTSEANGRYDSRPDTVKHIRRVGELLTRAIASLFRRREDHDLSKLRTPEREVFDEYTPKLAGSTYGSDEYRSFLAEMKPALDHHYANNSHHPEHWSDGILGMSLLDLTEMLCDWQAAGERQTGSSILRSIEINQKRFGYSDELKRILINTAVELGLASPSSENRGPQTHG